MYTEKINNNDKISFLEVLSSLVRSHEENQKD